MMKKSYDHPEIRTFSASEVLESLGPVSAGSGASTSPTFTPTPNPWGDGVDPNNPLG